LVRVRVADERGNSAGKDVRVLVEDEGAAATQTNRIQVGGTTVTGGKTITFRTISNCALSQSSSSSSGSSSQRSSISLGPYASDSQGNPIF
jgi:hypothetical protein